MGIAAWGPTLPGGARAVTLYVEADLAVVDSQYQPNAWGIGIWGEFRWQADAVWSDITDRLVSLTTGAGFDRATQTFQGGSLELMLRNDDGHMSRNNTNSPYYLPGIGSTIRASMPIRVRATYNNGSTIREWPLFTGFVKTWDPVYDAGGFDSKVSVTGVDWFSHFADFDGYEQTPQGASELSGARIHRILDDIGHDGPRSIAAGVHTMQATTLAANGLTSLKLTADSEGGWLYVGPSGRVIFEQQDALVARSRDVQVTFADDGRAGALRYLLPVQPRYSDDLLVTDAAFARVGSTTQVYTSRTARARYRRVAQERRTDLICETDAQALALAKRTVGLRQDARDRIDVLEFDPDGQNVDGAPDPALVAMAWEAISSQRLSLLSLARVVHTPEQPPDSVLTDENGEPITDENGDPIIVAWIDSWDQLNHVQELSHTITPVDWRVGVSFSAAEVWVGVASSAWGIGRWGEFRWSW